MSLETWIRYGMAAAALGIASFAWVTSRRSIISTARSVSLRILMLPLIVSALFWLHNAAALPAISFVGPAAVAVWLSRVAFVTWYVATAALILLIRAAAQLEARARRDFLDTDPRGFHRHGGDSVRSVVAAVPDAAGPHRVGDGDGVGRGRQAATGGPHAG